MSVDKSVFHPRETATYDFFSPTSALEGWQAEAADRLVPTHCCFCGVQCGMYLKVKDEQVVGVEPRDFPMNRGMLCPKGVTAYQQVHHPARLLHPLMRRGGRQSPFERVSWDAALEHVAAKLRALQQAHGKDAVAVISGSSMTNEKCYLMGKFARVALGTRHVDYNGRLCMSSATGANELAFGIDRTGNPVADIPLTDCLLIVGANVGECFPILTSWVWEARDRGARLIMADPRLTPVARTADLFLPLRPGTDSALLNGLLHVLVRDKLIDRDFIARRTVGFEKVEPLVAEFTPERVGRVCGLDPRLIERTAHMYGEAPKALIFHARGLEHQSKGVENALCAINLALATGKIGLPGSGYGTLTGQGNGQGGREHGQKASQLPGCRDIEDDEARRHISQVWGIEESELPHAGAALTEMIPLMLRGDIRGVLMLCTNPMVSLPDQHTVAKALGKLELFAAIDFFLSETGELADVVLPGTAWAEDEGTVTNLEARVIKYNRAADPPGECRRDWEIVCDLARRLGRGKHFDFHSPREIFDELRLASRGSKADYWGITYEKIEANQGVFWPCPDLDHPGTPRLFADRFYHADGKARFTAVPYLPPAEEPDDDYPFILTTGRVVYHYLSGNQTRRIPFLKEMAPHPWVEIHPEAAARLGIEDGELVRVWTRRGEIEVRAMAVETIRPDTLFIPYHFGAREAVNQLTNPVLEPHMKIPEFKVCAASLAPLRPRPAGVQGENPVAEANQEAGEPDGRSLRQVRRQKPALPGGKR